MNYNTELEDHIDHHFIDREELIKNKQMGGVGWLINGHMCCGIYEDLLVIRTEPSLVDALLKKPDIHLFSHRKGTKDTFLALASPIYDHPKARRKFLSHSFEYTSSLEPKKTEA